MESHKDVSSLPTITIDGRFFQQGRNRFIIKGVVYQPGFFKSASGQSWPDDPIRDDRLDEFQRDLELFKELGINTIFIYTIYFTNKHDKCMKLLADAGIYIIALLSENRCCILRNDPKGSYTSDLLKQYASKVDMLSQYTNVLGINVAHDLINAQTSLEVAPIVRTLIRDLKKHMEERQKDFGQRVLPICVGDDDQISTKSANFNSFTDTKDPQESIDFYMFNNYWAAPDSDDSKWIQAPREYAHSTIPIVISEYGNNRVMPRTFDEFDTLYSEDFLQLFSGGCVYELVMGGNGYGLVKISKEGDVLKLPDYYAYKEKLKTLTF